MNEPVKLPKSAKKRATRFSLVPFGEIKPVTKRNYIVKGMIPRNGIVLVYGPPKSGKSFFITDLLLHVALDWKFRGRPVKPGIVVYLACEGHSGFASRIEAFRQRFLAEDAEQEVPFYYIAANLDLVADKDALIQAIRAEIGTASPVVVCIDTVNRSLNGSESKGEDMGKYLRAAGAIVEAFACVVILVHHSGIDASRPRGHTSLTGAADVQIRVQRDGADNVVAIVEWMKDGPEGDQIVSKLEPVEIGTDEDGDALTSCVVIPVNGATPAAKAPKPPKMTKAAQIALRALREALHEAGDPAPTSNHIPTGVTVTTIDRWREYAYRMGISAANATPRAKQLAFKRALEHLVGSNIVAVWDPYVWITA